MVNESTVNSKLLKAIIAALVIVLIALQLRIWALEGSLLDSSMLEQELAVQQQRNEAQQIKNDSLLSEIDALKAGLNEVEARAREKLGMVKQDETFFLIMDKEHASSKMQAGQ